MREPMATSAITFPLSGRAHAGAPRRGQTRPAYKRIRDPGKAGVPRLPRCPADLIVDRGMVEHAASAAMDSISRRVFHSVCVKDYAKPADYRERDFPARMGRVDDFFTRRLEGRVPCRGARVLDVGCGSGATPIHLALAGAAHVVGVDINASALEFARQAARERYPQIADRVEFHAIGDIDEIPAGPFDVIVLMDTFEHLPEPARYVRALADRLAPRGTLANGFGPLWRSPYGGHIKHMTKVPWAHLLFPERVIMAERRRFAVDGAWDGAERFDDVKGGLNKMTVRRYWDCMSETGLEPSYVRTNVRSGRFAGLLRALSRIPFVREYFTFNIYSMWTKPQAVSGSTRDLARASAA